MDRPARTLAFVAAHPDDDVMGAAGIVALRRDDPDFRFVLIHATDGEAGEIAPGTGIDRAELGATRRLEDQRGWEVVGRVPDRHEFFGLPDGGLEGLPSGHLASLIAEVFAEERPDVVVTAGPDGVTGHPDHIAVGAAATAAFLRFAADGGPGFHRLLLAAWPQSDLDRTNAARIAAGLPPHDPTAVYQPRGVPDATITCSVDLGSVAHLVAAAFREHRTQWARPWSELDAEGWRRSAGATHLVQAWPAWQPGTPRLNDIFEGL